MKSVHSPKSKSLLYKQLDRDEMNLIGRLYMQLSYSLWNMFLRKYRRSMQSIYTSKLIGLLYKQIEKDKMNGIGRLYL